MYELRLFAHACVLCRYYCYECHVDEECVIPAHVVQNWDLKKFKGMCVRVGRYVVLGCIFFFLSCEVCLSTFDKIKSSFAHNLL